LPLGWPIETQCALQLGSVAGQADRHAAWELCAGVKGWVPDTAAAEVEEGAIASEEVKEAELSVWAFVRARSEALETRAAMKRILNGFRKTN